jgi:hypothetical protein
MDGRFNKIVFYCTYTIFAALRQAIAVPGNGSSARMTTKIAAGVKGIYKQEDTERISLRGLLVSRALPSAPPADMQ